MKRRTTTVLTALAAILAMSIPVGAAELHRSHQGTECKGGIETLHFVNNQLRDYDGEVYLWVELEGGTNIMAQAAADHPSANKHWWINVTAGTKVVNAWTTTSDNPTPTPLESDEYADDGPGRLVLSDYKCKTPPVEKK